MHYKYHTSADEMVGFFVSSCFNLTAAEPRGRGKWDPVQKKTPCTIQCAEFLDCSCFITSWRITILAKVSCSDGDCLHVVLASAQFHYLTLHQIFQHRRPLIVRVWLLKHFHFLLPFYGVTRNDIWRRPYQEFSSKIYQWMKGMCMTIE